MFLAAIEAVLFLAPQGDAVFLGNRPFITPDVDAYLSPAAAC